MSTSPLLSAEARVRAQNSFDKRCTVLTVRSPSSRRRAVFENLLWLGTPILLGVLLGLLLPLPRSLPPPFNRLSAIIGWTYFCAWSVSFYPQAYLNFRRKSVAGLSLDFQLLNMLGFACYAVYNSALRWSPTVRREYQCLHDGKPPAVHSNDVFFSLHAAAVTAVTLVQCIIYDRGGQKVSWLAALGTGGALATIAAYLAAVVGAAAAAQGGGAAAAAALGAAAEPLSRVVPCGNILSWLSFLYYLSYIKLGVSLVKYIPQVYLNYSRQSTDGWNIHNITLDFGGGLLSLAQQVLDSVVNNCWSPITGNPVKFGLGFTSMFFDVIFFAQHFCLYPAGGLQHAKAWAALEGAEGDEEEGGAGGCGGGARGSGKAVAATALPISTPGGGQAGGKGLTLPPASPVPVATGVRAGPSSSSAGSAGSSSEISAHEAAADVEAGGASRPGGGAAVVLAAEHTPLLR